MSVSNENTLTIAYSKGIAIVFADDYRHCWEDGIHVYKPSPKQLLRAVQDAIRYGERLVMIHESTKTWPFEFAY